MVDLFALVSSLEIATGSTVHELDLNSRCGRRRPQPLVCRIVGGLTAESICKVRRKVVNINHWIYLPTAGRALPLIYGRER